MVFTRAGPAEILRASQKDDTFAKSLQQMITDVIISCGGTRMAIRYRNLIEYMGSLLYYGNTTLTGLQTLGEEYTGIIQVDCTLRRLPSFLSRLLMITLDCFGSAAALKFLFALEKNINNNNNLQPIAKVHLLKVVSCLRAVIPYISHAHKALFYCVGGTYHIAKRITGINYVLMRYWLKDRESLYGFRILGVVTSLHLLMFGLYNLRKFIVDGSVPQKQYDSASMKQPNKSAIQSAAFIPKCSLCLEEVGHPSLTPCGHLYCWHCILEWLQTQPKCPLCRESVQPSRIVPLQNYF